MAGAAWADTYPRQSDVDVEHYVFRVAVSDTTDETAKRAWIFVRAAGSYGWTWR